jgi:hypothetical protein
VANQIIHLKAALDKEQRRQSNIKESIYGFAELV